VRTSTIANAARLRHTVLRPGVHVLRRSAEELQVGLDARRAVVLPDTAPVRRLLDALATPAAVPEDEYDRDAYAQLSACALLVDADTLLPLSASGGAAGSLSPGGLAALAAHAGDRTPALLDRRAGTLVEVVGHGAAAGQRTITAICEVLEDSGATTRRLPHGAAPAATPTSRTGVLVSVGEPTREHLDEWMRTGTAHLVVRLVEGQVLLGPFVLPGESACLRCVDAHHADRDPAWPLLVAQHASASRRQRADTLSEPVDPTLALLAAGWAARELLTHLEGGRPALTSATLRLDDRAASLAGQTWARHAGCGCGWG
jgi:bacteriocin biosynthesis cyclodehydratase domain-containing protein